MDIDITVVPEVSIVDDDHKSPYNPFGYPCMEISSRSTVIFRGERIRITEIEEYVARMEAEVADAYFTGNEAHEKEVANLKRAYEHEVNQLQETVAMYEAALKHEKRKIQ